MNNQIIVSKITGKSSKTGKQYNAVKLEIGDWSTLVFPRTQFEANYIYGILEAQDEE